MPVPGFKRPCACRRLQPAARNPPGAAERLGRRPQRPEIDHRRIGGNFPRIRIGIGPAPHGEAAMDFVLGSFTEAEEQVIKTVLPRAVDACLLFAKDGIDAVMNNFNS
jgi:hypothetical protein